MTVAIGLMLSAQAAAAKECHGETPLPADVHLIAPGPEVPEALARFAGAWIGAWHPSGIPGAMYQLGRLLVGRGRFALCHALVVEEVFTNGYARVIFSYGTYAAWNQRLPHLAFPVKWRNLALVLSSWRLERT